METLVIRHGRPEDLDPLKALADQHKRELGFVRRGALLESITRRHLLVAEMVNQPVGFVEFHHRQDGQTTIYLILVADNQRRKGIASALLRHLSVEALDRGQRHIELKCPVDLSANDFYSAFGFTLLGQLPGKLRSLNAWRFPLL